MRKFILAAVMMLSVVSVASADVIKLSEYLDKLPNIQQGVAWDFDKKEITYLSTLKVIDKYGFVLNAGYSTSDMAVTGISYELVNLKKWGVNVPILDLMKVEPIVYVGLRSINSRAIGDSEFSWGAGVNILEV